MPTYDFKIAKECLTETDKDRLLCLFLSCDTQAVNAIIDWEKATLALGSASVSSMRVMTRAVMKKIADKGGKIDDDGTTSTPKASAAPSKKRKAGKNDDDDEEGAEKTPTKKARRRKSKFAPSPSPVEDDQDVKKELWEYEE